MPQFSYHIQKNHISKTDSVTIDSFLGNEASVFVPRDIDGYQVTALDSYAFSPIHHSGTCQNIRHITLPNGLTSIGRYTFYGCRTLQSLKIPDSLSYIGAGPFVGCHNLTDLEYCIYQQETHCCLKEIIQELPQRLFVTLSEFSPDETLTPFARLVFPAYFEEAVENTPARITVSNIHGCGTYYRQCFTSGSIDFSKYDKQFPMAAAWENRYHAIELCLLRLRFPYQLSEEARIQYENFLKQHNLFAGAFCLGVHTTSFFQQIVSEHASSSMSEGTFMKDLPQMGGFDGSVLLTDSFSERSNEQILETAEATAVFSERTTYLSLYLSSVQPDKETTGLLLDLSSQCTLPECTSLLMEYCNRHFVSSTKMKRFTL